MTLADEAAARDEIFALHKAAWDAGPPSQGVKIFYQDVAQQRPSTQVPFLRIQVLHNLGGQGSLSGESGQRLWDRSGIITQQVFAPFADGLVLAYSLAKVAARAFEGKRTPSGVVFYRVRPQEVGEDGPYYQINVLAEFEYEMLH